MTLVLYPFTVCGKQLPGQRCTSRPCQESASWDTRWKHHEPASTSNCSEWFQGLWLYFQPEDRLLSFSKKGGNWGPEILDGMHKAPPYAGPTATVCLWIHSPSVPPCISSSQHTHSRIGCGEMGKWNHKSLMGRNLNYETQFPSLVCVQC